MPKIPASALVAAFQGYLAAKDGYIPNTAGELWTAEKQAKATSESVQRYGSKWIGHRVEDCSGAFVRAYRANGMTIYHGSNRIARVNAVELLPVSMARPGMAAFKGRNPGAEYYDLPSEYRPGGKYYNGDTVDYYHIGLVDSDTKYVINAQSTATGVVKSKLSDGWCAVAYLKDVKYDGEDKPMADEKTATVVSSGWTNLRSGPDTNAPRVEKLYPGDTVTIKKEYNNGWAFVQHGSKQGYVMTQYLGGVSAAEPDLDYPDPIPDAPAILTDETETVKLLYLAQEHINQAQECLAKLQAALTGAVG